MISKGVYWSSFGRDNVETTIVIVKSAVNGSSRSSCYLEMGIEFMVTLYCNFIVKSRSCRTLLKRVVKYIIVAVKLIASVSLEKGRELLYLLLRNDK